MKNQWIVDALLTTLVLGVTASCTPSPDEAVPKAGDATGTNGDEALTSMAESNDLPAEEETSPTQTSPFPTPPPSEEVTATTECQVGVVAGLDEYIMAKLRGQDRIAISPWIGAAPGQSYGIPGEKVEVLASALDEQCDRWVWVKWPESDLKGWLPISTISTEEDLTVFAGIGDTLTDLKCENYNSYSIIGLREYESYRLQGENQIAISPWFGAAEGKSYGLPDDDVLVIASVFADDCDQWILAQWKSGFRGWIPVDNVALPIPDK